MLDVGVSRAPTATSEWLAESTAGLAALPDGSELYSRSRSVEAISSWSGVSPIGVRQLRTMRR